MFAHVPFMRPVKKPVMPETDPPTYLLDQRFLSSSARTRGTHAEYINRLVSSPTEISFRDTRVPPEGIRSRFDFCRDMKTYHNQVSRAWPDYQSDH